ncbi:type VII secretion target [Saccharopolyspora sp. NPDC000359]|uniref:type VII secretion target n=1 Tax=Saccharopolyspora sp. NPDC000359 TaxID=3154251 RepID=UPI00331F5BDF
MAEGFQLSPDQLRAHAGRLDGHAAALGQAADAGRSVQLGTDAYGVICQFLPPVLNGAGDVVLQTTSAAHDAVAALSTALRDAVADHEATDAEIAVALDRIADELGG